MTMSRYNTKPCKCGAVTSVLVAPTGQFVSIEHRGFYPLYVSDKGTEYRYDNGLLVVPCRSCGSSRYARKVLGKFSATHKCNAKCLASKGFVCDCSCGGKNHGAGFEAQEVRS